MRFTAHRFSAVLQIATRAYLPHGWNEAMVMKVMLFVNNEWSVFRIYGELFLQVIKFGSNVSLAVCFGQI